MGYSIIFETKFIKLNDGRLLHLDRSGCNNDDEGRHLDDFSGRIYTEEELEKRAKSYMDRSIAVGWEMKIGSRYCTYNDYGKHLLRMAKRAVTYDEFLNQNHFWADRFDGVQLLEPEQRFLTSKEWSEYWYSTCEPYRYMRCTTRLKNESEIVNALENCEPVSFYVKRKH